MASRVRQIKIDEGIEPHLSREIKSERYKNTEFLNDFIFLSNNINL